MELTGLAATVLVFVTAFYTLALAAILVIGGKTVWHLVLENKKAWRMVASLSENPHGMPAAHLAGNLDLAEARNGSTGPYVRRAEETALAGA